MAPPVCGVCASSVNDANVASVTKTLAPAWSESPVAASKAMGPLAPGRTSRSGAVNAVSVARSGLDAGVLA